jgi:GTP-binding protein EngB required for normal cell division
VSAVTQRPTATTAPDLATADPLAGCLAAALEAADAADALGLATTALRAAHADGLRRVGFPGDAYVLALVGGTGVGKSSLLNALAGDAVSPASVRRPTTGEPVAWVPRTEREPLGPLLDWLGVDQIHEHDGDDLGPVAILDLPDVDSVAPEHRQRVEALLPRVDAVAWVTDPEKYADAVLHDDFLRAWLPRIARQVVVVNKADRLAGDDGQRIRRDVATQLRPDGSDVPILLSSTVSGHGIDDLRAWLASGVDAKAVVRERIAATLLTGVREVAHAAGADPATAATPFLGESERAEAIRETTAAVLRAIDLGGLRAQAIAATRAAARSRGTGPLGRVTSFIYRASGRQTAVADPNRFLLRWRERRALGPAVEIVRDALSGPLLAAPPAIRPTLAAVVEPGEIRRGLERAADRAIAGVGTLEPATSRWWSLIGLLQSLATVGIVLSAAWVVVWILARPATGSVQLPLLGSVPTPFASLVFFALAGYLLARTLGAHAGWVGGRWADRVRDRVAGSVEAEIRGQAFAPLDRFEEAHRRLRTAATTVEDGCGRSGRRRRG